MHACNKKTSNSKEHEDPISTLGTLQTPPLQGIAPRDSKKKKRKRKRYKLLLYRKGATTALEELERDVVCWTLDFNKKENRKLVKREIFLEVKKDSRSTA